MKKPEHIVGLGIQRVVYLILAAGVLMGAGACSSYDKQRNPLANALDINGNTTRRYHYLAENPFGEGLSHDGYIIGIEKAPRNRIAYSEDGGYERRFRFYRPDEVNPDRVKHLAEKIQNNRKAMFVSHILAYEPDRAAASDDGAPGEPQPRIRTRFLYNIYPDFGARTYGAFPEVPVITPVGNHYYEAGWLSLEQSLVTEIGMKLDAAATDGRPYTDLIIGAMGWDNDQTESVRRYNAIVSHVLEQSRRDGAPPATFNPLVIGITWPSVWGWDSPFDLLQLFYKLFGYGNKANDADEIGYTYANWLVNKLALDLRQAYAERTPPLRVIVFGHSFGARMVSRAVFSRTLLRESSAPDQHVDLLVGLQGAFSVHRFLPEKGNEGWPYADFPASRALVVMTWSDGDRANPLAYLLTRSPHIGGKRGYRVAAANHSIFNNVDVQAVDDTLCRDIVSGEQVVLVNASTFVSDHNDILNMTTGRLFWSAIRCVGND